MVNILSCFFSFLDAVTFVKDLLEICLKIFLVHKWSLMRTWILIRLITNADPCTGSLYIKEKNLCGHFYIMTMVIILRVWVYRYLPVLYTVGTGTTLNWQQVWFVLSGILTGTYLFKLFYYSKNSLNCLDEGDSELPYSRLHPPPHKCVKIPPILNSWSKITSYISYFINTSLYMKGRELMNDVS